MEEDYNLFNIDINKIKREHEQNNYKYDNEQNIKIRYQVLFYFLSTLLNNNNIDIITFKLLTTYITSYFNILNLKCQVITIDELCKKFIDNNLKNKDNNYLTINEIKHIYFLYILEIKEEIQDYINIDNLINIYSIMNYNYIYNETYKYDINFIKIYFNNNKNKIILILIYIFLNIILFLYKFIIYKNNEDLFLLYSYGPAFAKGFAQICLLNSFLILLPLSYGLIKFLYNFEFLRYYLPFNLNIKFHKLCGNMIFLSSIGHTISHLYIYINKIQKLSINVWENTDMYKNGGLNNGRTFINYISSLPGWSGIAMLCIFIFITPCTLNYIKKKHYNIFWYSHFAFFPLYFILLIIHGLNQWFETTTAWMWIIGPIIIYIIDRFYRLYNLSNINNTNISIVDSYIIYDIIILKLLKPYNFNNNISSMYLLLNIPIISKMEWHAFTIVSLPYMQYITLYIENNGDWTNTLYNIVQQNIKIPIININGPINSPSENYIKYDIIIMIGAGIGITPFLPIMKSIVLQNYKYNEYNNKHIYLYWCSRKQSIIISCIKKLNDIIKLDCNNIIEINLYLTNIIKNIHNDILSIIQYFGKILYNIDILSGLKETSYLSKFGRPDFDIEFKKILNKYENKNIGVLFCGSNTFQNEINKKCKKYSNNNNNVKFILHTEYF